MNTWVSPFKQIKLKSLENIVKANDGLMAFTDAFGLFLCTQGQAQVNVNGQNMTIAAGDLFIYIPSTYVYVQSTSADIRGVTYSSTMDFILPVLQNARLARHIITIRNYPKISLNAQQQENTRIYLQMINHRQDQLNAMEQTDLSFNILQEALFKLCEAAIHELIFDFVHNQDLSSDAHDNKDMVCQQFMLSLMTNYKQQREVQFYAEQQSLTPRYFSSVIREKTGKNAQQWIVSVVISGMKQTLLYTTKSIKEIANEYNFSTQSFFGKYFKQYVGLSPKEFRCRKPHLDPTI